MFFTGGVPVQQTSVKARHRGGGVKRRPLARFMPKRCAPKDLRTMAVHADMMVPSATPTPNALANRAARPSPGSDWTAEEEEEEEEEVSDPEDAADIQGGPFVRSSRNAWNIKGGLRLIVNIQLQKTKKNKKKTPVRIQQVVREREMRHTVPPFGYIVLHVNANIRVETASQCNSSTSW